MTLEVFSNLSDCVIQFSLHFFPVCPTTASPTLCSLPLPAPVFSRALPGTFSFHPPHLIAVSCLVSSLLVCKPFFFRSPTDCPFSFLGVASVAVSAVHFVCPRGQFSSWFCYRNSICSLLGWLCSSFCAVVPFFFFIIFFILQPQ